MDNLDIMMWTIEKNEEKKKGNKKFQKISNSSQRFFEIIVINTSRKIDEIV